MKRIILFAIAGVFPGAIAFSQTAVDAYRFAQPDLKGTARFMSMGGAFGALGGDLSTLSQNPAGIGVYRSNEIGFTLDLDVQNSKSDAQGSSTSLNQTKFLLNNIGGVATIKLPSSTIPNFNFGFTYNKAVSFNRQYGGNISNLATSMTNYIAGIANNEGIAVVDVESGNGFNAYDPNDGYPGAPWLTILGYDGLLINPDGDPSNPYWTAQMGQGTTGNGFFKVNETGSVDEYNIALGGNIANKLFWGMNFDIVNFDYRISALWGENLSKAYVYDTERDVVDITNSTWSMQNLYRANGTGFNYQLGFIFKPIQEFRIGFAFHTPTWYNLTETFSADVVTSAYGNNYYTDTNRGIPGSNQVNFQSPWKIIVSAAGVIGNKFIISGDYEWTGYKKMKFSEPTYNDYYYGWGGFGNDMYGTPFNPDIYQETNDDMSKIYQNTNTLRLGAEYRVTPKFSVRAGYSFVSSPVQASAKNNEQTIYTAGTMPNYRLDNTTNYITCGLGYRFGGFYADLAYVYKKMDSEYHAFTPDPEVRNTPSPQSKLTFNNSQIVLSMGFKF